MRNRLVIADGERIELHSTANTYYGTFKTDSSGRIVFSTANAGISSPTDLLYLSSSLLQTNGAFTIGTSTGNLTLATAAGNGNVSISTHGSGIFSVYLNSTQYLTLEDTSGVALATLVHPSNASSTAHARVMSLTGGASGGDPSVQLSISGAVTWSIGLDNDDSDVFKIGPSSSVGTSTKLKLNTSGQLFINDQISIGSNTYKGRLYLAAGQDLWTTSNWNRGIKMETATAFQFTNATTHYGLGSTANSLYLWSTTVDDTSDVLTYQMIFSGGKVSIGPSAPSYDLHVIKAADPTLVVEDTTNTVRTFARSTDSEGILGTLSSHQLGFYLGGARKAYIDTSSNFFIGGQSDATRYFQCTSNGLVTLSFDDNSIQNHLTLQNKYLGASYGSNIQFKLGDGSTASTAANFKVITATSWSSNANKNANLIFELIQANSVVERLKLTYQGYLGLTNSSPTAKIDIGYGALKFTQLAAPSAPTAVSVSTTPGSLATGNYAYKVTFMTEVGETNTSASTGSITAAAGFCSISISGLSVGSAGQGVISRRLYRSYNGGGYQLITTISDNTTTSYIDSGDTAGYEERQGNNTTGFIYRDSQANLYLPTGGGLAIGTGAPLPNNATKGFLYIPRMDVTQSGSAIPIPESGTVPMFFNTLNNSIYIYNPVTPGWLAVALA